MATDNPEPVALDEKALEAAAPSPQIPAGGLEPDARFDSPALEAARDIMKLASAGKYDDYLKAKIQLRIMKAMATIASPPSPQADPVDGWRLVPVDPTLKMQNAGWREIDKQGFQIEDMEVAPIYHAMLSAAPKPETSPATGPEVGGENG